VEVTGPGTWVERHAADAVATEVLFSVETSPAGPATVSTRIGWEETWESRQRES
jgi:hypothetical protein